MTNTHSEPDPTGTSAPARPESDGPHDPFAILGVRPRFDLDAADLQRKWLELAARLHPDLAPDPDDAGRRLARISAAKAILDHPESRADALLVALGGPTKESCAELPPGILLEIMEIREQLEQAAAERDQPTIDRLRAWASAERAAYIADIAARFAALEGPVATPGQRSAALRAIRTTLNAWRYIERMIEQAG